MHYALGNVKMDWVNVNTLLCRVIFGGPPGFTLHWIFHGVNNPDFVQLLINVTWGASVGDNSICINTSATANDSIKIVASAYVEHRTIPHPATRGAKCFTSLKISVREFTIFHHWYWALEREHKFLLVLKPSLAEIITVDAPAWNTCKVNTFNIPTFNAAPPLLGKLVNRIFIF